MCIRDRRYGGELQLRHQFQPSGDFISELNLFAEGKYFHTEATSQRENGTFAGDVDGSKLVTGNAYRIQADNAFLPSDLRAMLTAAGVARFDITRNDRDFGIRTYESVYDTTRFVTGIDGAFSNGWRFEAYVNYGQTESQFTNFDRLQKEFYESIDAINLNGQIVCRSEDALSLIHI